MLLNKTIVAATPYLKKIYAHPFQQKLRDGTLPTDIFQDFIIQDDLYLQELTKTLQIITNRENSIEYRKVLQYLTNYIHKVERNIHCKYGISIEHNKKPYFFNQKIKNHLPNNTVIQYVEHLNLHAKYSELPVAIASITPCFYIYNQLGTIDYNLAPNNIYKNWLKSYSSTSFTDATQKINKIYENYGNTQQNLQLLMLQNFITSTKYELAFLDSYSGSILNLYNFL